MSNVVNSADLFMKEGSSDKEYHAQIVEDGGAYTVNFQYGRRGSSLNSGTKAAAVSWAKAQNIFEKLVNEKRSKGYRVAETGSGAAASYQAIATDDVQTDFRPQLLNIIDEARLAELLADDDWILQEKIDGKRISIRKDATGTVAINRKGKIVSIPQEIIDEVNRIPRDITLDGELVGDKYYAFDIASFGGAPNTIGFGKRLASLVKIGAGMNWGVKTATVDSEGPVLVVCGCQTTAEKRVWLETIRAAKGEGVVFKNAQANYTPGRPNSGGMALKYKFTAMATCGVSNIETGKRSVSLTVRDGNFSLRKMGKVTIPPNFDPPKPGDLVEVRYLYAYPNGALYQPIYLGVRDDLEAPDDYSTLKFKQGTDDDEEG